MLLTFSVSPFTSPVTSTRRWSFLLDDLSCSTTCLFPAESSFRTFWSGVTMAKPPLWHCRAQPLVCESGLDASFLAHIVSRIGASLNVSSAQKAGSVNIASTARNASFRMGISPFSFDLLKLWFKREPHNDRCHGLADLTRPPSRLLFVRGRTRK